MGDLSQGDLIVAATATATTATGSVAMLRQPIETATFVSRGVLIKARTHHEAAVCQGRVPGHQCGRVRGVVQVHVRVEEAEGLPTHRSADDGAEHSSLLFVRVAFVASVTPAVAAAAPAGAGVT